MSERREAEAFADALASTPAEAITACAGWRAHEVVAHLVSGVEAIADQAEADLAGLPIPSFGSFAARETELWRVSDAELRRRLVAGERRMTDALERQFAAGPDRVVPDVGWGMPMRDISLHLRQEFAVHRWDLVGDDGEGDELLGRPELIDHAVRMMAPSLVGSAAAADEVWSVRIRSDEQPDLVIGVDGGRASAALVAPGAEPADVECDAAARLLLLWGRRPATARRVRTRLDPARLRRLQAVMRGF